MDQATFSTTTLAVGPHTISAAYGGDTTFAASTATPLTQTVDAPTSTTLSSPANPSTVGQSVTFTATVSGPRGAGTPSGSVSFDEGSTTLDSAALNAAGQATFTTSMFALGSDFITAVYAATGSFLTSASAPLAQVVNAVALQAATTTTLSSSANPSTVGQTVIFTATVAPVTGIGSTPTGTVIFAIDGKADSPVTLTEANGKDLAAFTMPDLAAGRYTVSADYSGDTVFAASDSSSITQVVNPLVTVPPPVTTPPSDGPKITSVLRYRYHMRPTTVVLAFDQALDAITA